MTRWQSAAIALAFLARPQLGVLAIVLPIAVAAYEIGASGRPAGRALRGALAKHRLAGVVYAVGIVGAVGLLASGRLAGALGVYGSTVTGNLVPHGIPKSLAWHLACFSLGVGILPLVARGRVAPGAVLQAAGPAGAARVRVPRRDSVGRGARSGHRLRPPLHRRPRPRPLPDLPRADRVPRLRLRPPRFAQPYAFAGMVTFVVAAGFAFGAIPTQALGGVNSDGRSRSCTHRSSRRPGLRGRARTARGGTIALVVLYWAAAGSSRVRPSSSRLRSLPSRSSRTCPRTSSRTSSSIREVGAGGHEPERSEYSWIDQKVGPTAASRSSPTPPPRISGQRA